MAVVFTPNKQLQAGDLNLAVRNTQGSLFDPAYIAFTIFQKLDNRDVLVLGPKMIPAKSQQGIYYINITIPTSWLGDFKLVWYLREQANMEEKTVYEDFSVLPMVFGKTSQEAPSIGMAKNPLLTPTTANMVIKVRELLSDDNPDRNYHFRPATAAKTIAGFSDRVGFIWEDKTIIRFLEMGISLLNSANPKVMYHYSIDTAPDAFTIGMVTYAAAKCLSREACRWQADEFSYSLNGVSLDLAKAQGYQGLSESLMSDFNEMKLHITEVRPASVGLRQNRWLI